MWFILLGVALVTMGVTGMYVNWRLAQAVEVVFQAPRAARVVRWFLVYLLFFYPILVFGMIGISLALGHESPRMSMGPLGEWLLAMPFFWAVLLVLQASPFLLVTDIGLWLRRKKSNRERRHRRRAFMTLGVCILLGLYTPIRILAEAGALRVRHFEVSAPNASTARKPFRIAFFGDLQHDRHTDAAKGQEVVDIVNGAHPDLILVGGDWINSGPDHIEQAGKTAAELRARWGALSVRGDHEHFAYRDRERSAREVQEALARAGVAMLDNQVRRFEHEGKSIAVAFLSYNYIVRTPEEGIRSLLEELQGADMRILLSHQFDAKVARLVADKVDLILAAHTHGGQVNPLVGVTHIPIARVETRYVDGRYALGAATVIVTAGIGFSIAPFRYASPGSVEIIDLHL